MEISGEGICGRGAHIGGRLEQRVCVMGESRHWIGGALAEQLFARI
jgi:hypothetical protein